MSKRNFEMEDSELRDLEERYVEMMKEMEKDKQTQSFQIPEEWDKKFQQTIDETLKEQWKKRRMRRVKNVGVAAAVLLAVTFGVDRGLVAVHGDGLMEVVQSVLNENDKNYVVISDNKDIIVEDNDKSQMYFKVDTLDKAYEQIRQKVLRPILYMAYMPKGYMLKETQFDQEYQVVNFVLEKNGKKIYIYQQLMADDGSSGNFSDEEKIVEIENTNLKQKVSIYKSNQDDSLVFSINYKNNILTFNGLITLKECEKIAENICYE